MWVDLLTWSKKGRNDVKYVFSQLIFWKMNAVPLSLFIGMHFVSNAILLSLPGWFSLYLQSIKFKETEARRVSSHVWSIFFTSSICLSFQSSELIVNFSAIKVLFSEKVHQWLDRIILKSPWRQWGSCVRTCFRQCPVHGLPGLSSETGP